MRLPTVIAHGQLSFVEGIQMLSAAPRGDHASEVVAQNTGKAVEVGGAQDPLPLQIAMPGKGADGTVEWSGHRVPLRKDGDVWMGSVSEGPKTVRARLFVERGRTHVELSSETTQDPLRIGNDRFCIVKSSVFSGTLPPV